MEKDQVFASREEVAALANNMAKLEDSINKVVAAVTSKRPVAVEEKPVELEALPDEVPVPPSYRQSVDEILGKDFGCRVVYSADGSGFLFEVIVPSEKSNAGKDYLDAYKYDIRSRSLANGEGLAGVREWCSRVRKNLQKSGVKLAIQ